MHCRPPPPSPPSTIPSNLVHEHGVQLANSKLESDVWGVMVDSKWVAAKQVAENASENGFPEIN